MKLERQQDRYRENSARLRLEQFTGLKVEKIHKEYSRIDWAVLKDSYDTSTGRWDFRLLSWAEFKGQNKGLAYATQYGFILSLDKWLHLKHMARNTGMPFWLMYGIRTTKENMDFLGEFWHDSPHTEILKGGRTDRNLSSDKDFIVRLPFHHFAPLNSESDWEAVKDRFLIRRDYQGVQ
jgi:hypothetical protein